MSFSIHEAWLQLISARAIYAPSNPFISSFHRMLLFYLTGTLPIIVDMNRVPQLDFEEEEQPPPLPVRSNTYVDTPSHTFQTTLDSDSLDEEQPPPLPVRSNIYVDTPSHTFETTVDRDSVGGLDPQEAEAPRRSDVSAPVIPPKPAHMRLNALL